MQGVLLISSGSHNRVYSTTLLSNLFRKVAGVPLLKRALLTAKRAGIKEIIVIGPPITHEIRRRVDQWGKLGVLLHWVVGKRQESGLELLNSSGLVRSDFIILKPDQLVHHDVLKRLMEASCTTPITKATHRYTSGIYRLSPDLISEVEQIGFSNLVSKYLSQGEIKTIDVNDLFWIEITDNQKLKVAERQLYNSLRKTTDGVIARYVNRPLSLLMSRFLIQTSVSANQISFFCFFLGLLAATLVSFGQYWGLLTGALIFKLTSILDGVDGEIAKLKFQESRFGEWLDTFVDSISYLLFWVGISIGTYLRYGHVFALFLGGLAVCGHSYAIMSILRRAGDSNSLVSYDATFNTIHSEGILSTAVKALRTAGKRDFFTTLIVGAALFNQYYVILVVAAISGGILAPLSLYYTDVKIAQQTA